ncbi:phosphotransferase enzyme family protein [Nocardia asteroides]|uniref:Homoserine kinase type II n=1 Tax=Nocardia asteroides NBRC 15531 TaxID=1110697 RepID=U5EA75_NOCAS|nr:phosphotransferase [Nocardia asteroides]UGT47263.1 phosphotransferase [Nocardia asteroides]GAD87007.1 homoserine kinase type II [Nocardia asteroides NBRC 15531]SFM74470.1 Phosphotransferase enzyme family protein [Nocardia asteroides]VEG33848.1 Homoserine kinase [Nocardia asteroides]
MTGHHVFGMGDAPAAAPTWPPPTETEIAAAVAATRGGPELVGIEWRSARPLSATVGARLSDGAMVVVKRVPSRLRDLAALAEEHRFMTYLRDRGVPIPEVRAVSGEPAGRAGFVYEVQRAGVGVDRYRSDFSWSPYRDTADAAAAGAMLAQLHVAAAGFDAPARPARPLVASLHGSGPWQVVEWHRARRPAVARFLDDRDWRADLPDPRVDLSGVDPLWTHGDWHPTNLLWTGNTVTSVFDFGLADRTTAVFDLATAVERAVVDWVSLRDGGPAHVRADQVRALVEGYRAVRPLPAAEQRALAEILPVVHLGYELSEIDYFLTVSGEPRNAEIAYQDWLLGHLTWFHTADGRAVLDLVRDAARD